MDSLLFTALYWISIISRAASVVVFLLMGILIIVSRAKSVKVLGVSFVISAVSSGISFVSSIIVNQLSSEQMNMLQISKSIIDNLCVYGSYVCICLFLHRNYGKKKIYYPVLIIPFAAYVLSVIVAVVINKGDMINIDKGIYISMIQSTISFVSSAVVACIIIRVMYKNRHNEKIIPHVWICRTILLIWALVGYVFTMVSYSLVISKTRADLSLAVMIFDFAGALVSMIAPVYVFAGTRKAPCKKLQK